MEINIIAIQVREIMLREWLAHRKEWLLWYTPVIPQLQRLGQEALKPKANLDYVETLPHRDSCIGHNMQERPKLIHLCTQSGILDFLKLTSKVKDGWTSSWRITEPYCTMCIFTSMTFDSDDYHYYCRAWPKYYTVSFPLTWWLVWLEWFPTAHKPECKWFFLKVKANQQWEEQVGWVTSLTTCVILSGLADLSYWFTPSPNTSSKQFL